MRFKEWLGDFSMKYLDYLEQLTDVGVEYAQTMFDLADPVEQSGIVTVSKEVDGFDAVIRASGDAAPFIEFGTGIQTMVVRPTVQASYDISDGSYSREREGPYSKRGFWYYKGIKFTGTAPLMPMQSACDEMEQTSENIARRVFR